MGHHLVRMQIFLNMKLVKMDVAIVILNSLKLSLSEIKDPLSL